MKMLFTDPNVLFVVLLFPLLVDGFALVQQHKHHPFDAFKARRKFHGNVVSGAHRNGLPTFLLGSNRQFTNSFSSLISKTTTKGRPGETRNKTLSLSDKDISLLEIRGNSTNSTNSTMGNKTGVLLSEQNSSKPSTEIMNSQNKTSLERGFGSYFSFVRQPGWTARKDTPTVSKTSNVDTKKNNENRSSNKNSNSNKTVTATGLLNKQANDIITVADLDILLQQIKSDSDSDKAKDQRKGVSKKSTSTNGSIQTTISSKSSSESSSSSSSSQVGVPQRSEVSEKDIRRSTAIVGCFLGMITGITILPNLWLVGMVAGVLYGYEITKDLDEDEEPVEKNIVANFMVKSGTQIAKAYRITLDGMKALWFLYKTGQLSYEYYKSYETLDRKFAIQDKIDAWNSVFVKGKQKFDAWEQQNEVGRKVLAGIRTAWLVDEESRKRAAGRSRYRLVQYFYDFRRSANRFLKKAISFIRSLFEDDGLQTFWKGLQADLQRKGSLPTRLEAVVAAIVAVNICGALFSLSAGFSNLLAILGAVIWPTWTNDLFTRTREIWVDLQSRGSSEETNSPIDWIRNRYEEYSRDRVQEARKRNPRAYRRNRTLFISKRTKPPKANRRIRNRSILNRSNRKQRGRPGGEIGTWGYFRRTRY